MNGEKYINNIEKSKITKQEGNFSFLVYFSLLPECFAPYTSRYYDFDFDNFLFIAKPGYGILFFNMGKYIQTSIVSFERFLELKNIDDFRESKDYLNASDRIFDLYNKVDLFSLGDSEEDQLVDLIKQAYELYWDLLSSTVFSEAVDEDLIKDLYKKVGGKDSDIKEFLDKVSLLSFESFSLRFERQLMEFLSTGDLKEVIWVFSDYYDSVNKIDFKNKLDDFINNKGGKDAVQSDIFKTEKVIKENIEIQQSYYDKLPEGQKRLFDFIKMSMKYRDVRKNALQRIITIITYTARAIFKHNNLSDDLVLSSYYRDFYDKSYKDLNYEKELKNRQNCVAYLDNPKDGVNFEYTDPDETINMVYGFLENKDNSNEIKGNPACKGIVRGVVRVILSEPDFNKFREGDILVTSMTRPEFVPIMKKSLAVVTDEGGITCHAAIVSRELGIPCVIGTKTATRFLKDGMEVEVDADNGIIKIINK